MHPYARPTPPPPKRRLQACPPLCPAPQVKGDRSGVLPRPPEILKFPLGFHRKRYESGAHCC